MYKTILITFFLISGSKLLCNIITPKVNISEILIESDSVWSVELFFPDHTDVISFDSIEIETSAGRSKINSYSLIDITESGSSSSYISVITNSSLARPLNVNPHGDFVKIYSYILGSVGYDFIAFGNYPGSFFLNYQKEYSLALTDEGLFSLNRTPSIGERNTDEGTQGTVQGFLLDKNHHPIENTPLLMFGTDVKTNENGYYSQAILSRTYFIEDTLTAWLNPTQTFIFEPDTINVIPDSVSEANIILLEYIINSNIIIDPRSDPDVFLNYPNPFKDVTTFYLYLPVPDCSTATLQILNNRGQLVVAIPVPVDEMRIALVPDILSSLPAGIYHYTLLVDGKSSGLVNTMVKL
jgi:hypothetical protein